MRDWLKKLREDLNLRQVDMAKNLSMSVQQYNFIENGKRQEDMNLSTAAKIADFFDIPLSKIRQYEEVLAATRENSV